MLLVFAWGFSQRQRRRDYFEMEKWRAELEIRREELELARGAESGSTNTHVETPDPGASIPYGGYAFVDVPDDYKGLFHDTIKGFEEFARLKGYRISIAIDTTPPGKIGLRFTILDQGVTVSTETVKSDVDEYMTKFKESDTFEDLPIVIDRVEHERLKAALTARFTMVKNNAEMYKVEADFYKRLLKMSPLKAGGVSYLPASPVIINNQLEHGGSQMARETYSADRSPGAAVGKDNTASIEGSTITIGSTLTEKNKQVDGLSELIELVTRSELQNKEDAARHLTNVREELTDGNPPNEGLIDQFLGKAKNILALAEKGTGIYEKAKEMLAPFNLNV
ncbi:MAG: hypothetical protein OXC18_18095 [Desulfurellaceae bacterium]|nr:hypothetical protein [Desulfurellaceae bacterium]